MTIFAEAPPSLASFFIAMLPISEVRGAIPLAMGFYKMSAAAAFFWSVLGNIFIAAILVYFLDPLHKFLAGKFNSVDKIFNWLFKRTRKNFGSKYEIWGNLALMIFVAIPLPMTGAWSGALAAWLFGIRRGAALFYISLGVIIAAGIVTLATLGIIHLSR